MLTQLGKHGLVPVIRVTRAADAVPLCAALMEGGLPVAEITFRSPAAKEAIRLVHRELPGVLLGAGTVLTIQQAEDAMQAGAGYLVSPGLNPKVLSYAVGKGYPMLPGCMTPSEIEQALDLSIRQVKFFPAEAAGGVSMLKALSGPYREVRFVPTGGIHEQNLADYLRLPNVLACGGSFMVPEAAINSGDWAAVTLLTQRAVALVKEAREQG